MFACILAWFASSAQAGLFVDWWVPKDGHCQVHPQEGETKRAAAEDVRECRAAHTVTTEADGSKTDWSAVMTCMTSRGWEKKSRTEWEGWILQCEEQVSTDEHLFLVVTEELVEAHRGQNTQVKSGDVLLSVPPGMLGRDRAEPPGP